MSINRNHFQGNMKIPELFVKIFGTATHMAIKLISYICHLMAVSLFSCIRPNRDQWKNARKYNKKLEKILAENNLR